MMFYECGRDGRGLEAEGALVGVSCRRNLWVQKRKEITGKSDVGLS